MADEEKKVAAEVAEVTTEKTEEKKDNATQPEAADNSKIIAALAYFGILFFLPLVVQPVTKFGRFHANQGLILFIASMIVNTLGMFVPFIGWFLIWPIGGIFLVVLFIMGLVNAFNGEEKRLPLIGGFDLIK